MTTDHVASCREENRRANLLSHPFLNGIDAVKYERRLVAGKVRHFLVVTMLKPLPDPPTSDPDGAYGLTTTPELVHILGGSRIVGIDALSVALAGDQLEIEVSDRGDFSVYTLALGWRSDGAGGLAHVTPALDRVYSRAAFGFRDECPIEFDCRDDCSCNAPPEPEPHIDYLAKDYASFLRLLTDFAKSRNPNWTEDSPADVGVMLMEILAYAGDHLSYAQDAVANERSLDTSRLRVSARRHARLVDYRMHDGRNAWAWVHVQASASGSLPQGTRLMTRMLSPIPGSGPTAPGVEIDETNLTDDIYKYDPVVRRSRVFETTHPLSVDPLNNTLYIHTRGDTDCCLLSGATEIELYALQGLVVTHPTLSVGDLLLIEEVRGPETGAEADADPAHRYVVRLESVEQDVDAMYSDHVSLDDDGEPALSVFATGNTPMPILRVRWSADQALPDPVCVSAEPALRGPLANVSVARGNIALADHGRTVLESFEFDEPIQPRRRENLPFTLKLSDGPLTMQYLGDSPLFVLNGSMLVLANERYDVACELSEVEPAVALEADFPSGSKIYTSVPQLLESSSSDTHFVTEVEADGSTRLRFGDDEYGAAPTGATAMRVTYRVGNGTAGNVGAEAIAHVVRPSAPASWPRIEAIRNPIAATDGRAMETIEEVRQNAPAAFRALQYRAVTTQDYIDAALRIEGVSGAVAAFRWFGSWHTVVVAIDPTDQSNLLYLPGGQAELTPSFARYIHDELTECRLAGYDLRIRAGSYVPLEVELKVCAEADYFRQDIKKAVLDRLSSGLRRDGTPGFFHPDNLSFGDDIAASRIIAAVGEITGVSSVELRRLTRFGQLSEGALVDEILPIGDWEIARLDNDPNFMERGVLKVSIGGGK
ncbi:MAG: putative baseplate assembly protein [Phycisphaerales bacterium]